MDRSNAVLAKFLTVFILILTTSSLVQAQAPIVSLSTTSLTFNNQVVFAASGAKSTKVTNSGTAVLNITSITASGDFAHSSTCGSSVLPGKNCQISVTFNPTAVGARNGALTITDNASGSPHVVNLSGTGIVPVTVSPLTWSFPNQAVGTTSPSKAVSLTNQQAVSLSISNIATSGDFAQTNNCGASVAAGGTCTISVQFTPTGIGTRTGSLTITNSATTSPQNVALSGTGIVNLTLSSSSLNFGNVTANTTSAIRNVTLSNSSTVPIAISSLVATGNFTQTNNCGSSLAAQSLCTISIRFAPTTAGAQTGAVTITDAASNSPQSISLSGTGGVPPVSISPASLSFGSLLVGTASLTQTATVTNTGNGNVTGITVAVAGDFSQINTCPSTLSGGASCTVTVGFTPTAAGNRNGCQGRSKTRPLGRRESRPLQGVGEAVF